MFQHNLGTKELVDALVLCREALLNLPVQQIPRFKYFTDTQVMGQYIRDLVDATEGQASGASKAKASSLSAANEVDLNTVAPLYWGRHQQ